jgi:mannose-6-phosphate isomerase
MKSSFTPDTDKQTVFENIEQSLLENNFDISNKDENRPWGGFFVINEKQADSFVENYFSSNKQDIATGKKLSPKILIVQPGKRLSWQYHFRRAELWKVISGEVGVATSDTDDEKEMKKYSVGSIIKLKQGERHRLIGLDNWGVVAEIWQHTDNLYPSDEDDIIRLQDDFGR